MKNKGLCFQDTGLHYDRYLREVIEYLEKDPHFREKLKTTNMDDIKVNTTGADSSHVTWNPVMWRGLYSILSC